MKFYLPKWIAIMLTTLQIVQMLWCIIITISAYYYVQIVQVECNVTFNFKLSALIYFSYFIFFINFFEQTYLSNKHVNNLVRKKRIKLRPNEVCKIYRINKCNYQLLSFLFFRYIRYGKIVKLRRI